jgi:hypothetical protein
MPKDRAEWFTFQMQALHTRPHVFKKLLRRADYITGKGGEEMKKKATKGEFWKFIEDASENKELKIKFLKKLEEHRIDAKGLQEFLYELGYRGVSQDECEAILAQIKDPKKLLEAWNAQY